MSKIRTCEGVIVAPGRYLLKNVRFSFVRTFGVCSGTVISRETINSASDTSRRHRWMAHVWFCRLQALREYRLQLVLKHGTVSLDEAPTSEEMGQRLSVLQDMCVGIMEEMPNQHLSSLFTHSPSDIKVCQSSCAHEFGCALLAKIARACGWCWMSLSCC